MRLPLRHPPPPADAPLRRCAHLIALAEQARGLGLGPAAALVAPPHARGRFGNALQWHFGLEPHDSSEQLDWEDRVELKLVSVWRRRDGRIACDKLKVCDITMDPRRKLGNVLWVFADRTTRVIVGHRFTRLAGPLRASLAGAWDLDPHFDHPPLFVEAREQDLRQAPAYYLGAAWLATHVLPPDGPPGSSLPGSSLPGIFRFDARWWSEARGHGRRRRDPQLALWRGEASPLSCPRCAGPLRFDPDRVRAEGWTPAVHAMPLGPDCGLRAHAVVDAAGLPAQVLGWHDLAAAVEGRTAPEQVDRLSDHVLEPDDHEHD